MSTRAAWLHHIDARGRWHHRAAWIYDIRLLRAALELNAERRQLRRARWLTAFTITITAIYLIYNIFWR